MKRVSCQTMVFRGRVGVPVDERRQLLPKRSNVQAEFFVLALAKNVCTAVFNLMLV